MSAVFGRPSPRAYPQGLVVTLPPSPAAFSRAPLDRGQLARNAAGGLRPPGNRPGHPPMTPVGADGRTDRPVRGVPTPPRRQTVPFRPPARPWGGVDERTEGMVKGRGINRAEHRLIAGIREFDPREEPLVFHLGLEDYAGRQKVGLRDEIGQRPLQRGGRRGDREGRHEAPRVRCPSCQRP